MKLRLKYITIAALIISIISLSVSFVLLWRDLLRDGLPSGVTEIEIPEKGIVTVTIDSKSYGLSLVFYTEYGEWCEMKVETSSGYQIRNLYLGKTTSFYDLRITMKEPLLNSIIVWIEKKE